MQSLCGSLSRLSLCPFYGSQRVLEGEKAQRSECARKLRDVERKLAALKNPSWWPASASPGSQSEQLLLRQKQELNRQLDLHSKQVGGYAADQHP